MENNNEILHELKEISPLLTRFDNKSPYTVSFSYFSSLAENIVEKIKTGAEPDYHFTREIPYSAPADYFANLSATVIKKIRKETAQSEVIEEMEEFSPLLNSISKKPVYTVPGAYFENVEWNKGETTPSKAKVRSLIPLKNMLRYAVAAIIIGLLAVGLFLFTGKQDTTSQVDYTKAAYEVKKLSEQEIVDFLKTTPSGSNVVINNYNTGNKDSDIKSIVSKMSDNEIQRFLEENGEQDEM